MSTMIIITRQISEISSRWDYSVKRQVTWLTRDNFP